MKKISLLISCLFLCGLIACGESAPPPTPTPEPQIAFQPGEKHITQFQVGTEMRTYHIYIPADYTLVESYPLIINLHPFGTSAAQQELISSLAEKATAQGIVVVNPQGVVINGQRQWRLEAGADNPDIQMLQALLVHLGEQLILDRQRIYVTGFSNGGGLTHRVGCEMADKVAAIAPLAGVYPIDAPCEPARPIPILALHGTADEVIPYDGAEGLQGLLGLNAWTRAWAVRNGCGPGPVVTQHGRFVSAENYINCTQNATVSLYTITDWGHRWPNTKLAPPGPNDPELDATDTILNFFAKQTLGN